MEVFHQFRENLKGLKAEVGSSSGGGNIQYVGYVKTGNIQNILDIQVGSSGGGGNCETSEYASEVSEDYNSVDGSTSEARLVKDTDKYKHKHRQKTYTNTNTSLRGLHLLFIVILTSRCTWCFGWWTRCFSLYTWCLGALDVFGIRLMYQLHFVFGICLNFGKAVHSFLCLSTLACKKYAPASSDCSD